MQRRAGKALNGAERAGAPEEERKAQPHRRQLQKGQRVLGRGRSATLGGGWLVAPGTLAVVERIAVDRHDDQHHQRQTGAAQAGNTPRARGRGNAGHEHRRRGPSQVARNAVHGKAVAQALGGHALVENGEVHRMKRRIAQTRQQRRQNQRGIAAGRACHHARRDEARQRKEQHRPRAHAVHDKARQHLPHARDHEEHRHQQPKL
ncbi:hypothetical protein SDC9_70507 [bioreactor metagenome]|uniref:Uncharacterized protein n=1 Tax=bioreactor metagenome TaxID=1076179 RepID=A0A644Y6F6_9ZZZZ